MDLTILLIFRVSHSAGQNEFLFCNEVQIFIKTKIAFVLENTGFFNKWLRL